MRTLFLAFLGVAAGSLATLAPAAALADTGAPPPDQKALVAAPAPVAAPPKIDANANDATAVTISTGGQFATGNSRLIAMTANGKFEMRRGANGFGAGVIGNYGESGLPAADGTPSTHTPMKTSTENFQGRLRYDRYVLDNMSIFLIGTVRHDKFQGLDGRLNIDPGLKYLFVQDDATNFWAELGYDFQYDARNGNPAPTADGTPTGAPLALTATSHSARAFVGFKHAFNSAVNVVTGIEYLQALASSDNVLPGANTDSRINFDALFAANVGAGLSLGLGFSARYDNVPIGGKQQTDTVTTFNLIYAFTDVVKPPPPPTCPCPEAAPPPPPPSAPPASAPTPAPAAPPAPASPPAPTSGAPATPPPAAAPAAPAPPPPAPATQH